MSELLIRLRTDLLADDVLSPEVKALQATPEGQLARGMARGLMEWLKPEFNVLAELHAEHAVTLLEAIGKLERRIAELEQRPLLEDGDIWEPEKSYRPGTVVQDRNSRWVCRSACTNSRPPSGDWRLWLKSK